MKKRNYISIVSKQGMGEGDVSWCMLRKRCGKESSSQWGRAPDPRLTPPSLVSAINGAKLLLISLIDPILWPLKALQWLLIFL